ncbi:MAG TPA: hypothetical protein V6C88_15135 [Chroococcidiopsis sp.]
MEFHQLKSKVFSVLLVVASAGGTLALFGSVPLIARLSVTVAQVPVEQLNAAPPAAPSTPSAGTSAR